MDNCAGLERDRPVEIPNGVVLLEELGCIVYVVAELENKGSLATLEDIVIWMKLISVVNATTDSVCEELDCELKLLNSAGLCKTVADEKAEKLADTMLVEGNNKID